MNVYKITPTIAYSGGCALVAAHSESDAEILFRADDYRDFEFKYGECEVSLCW